MIEFQYYFIRIMNDQAVKNYHWLTFLHNRIQASDECYG